MACAFLGIWFEINLVDIGAGIAIHHSDRPRAETRRKRRAMGPKATRKSSKQLKKSKRIQPVKSLRLAVRKASGDQPIEY
jgi:hypothetical protein